MAGEYPDDSDDLWKQEVEDQNDRTIREEFKKLREDSRFWVNGFGPFVVERENDQLVGKDGWVAKPEGIDDDQEVREKGVMIAWSRSVLDAVKVRPRGGGGSDYVNVRRLEVDNEHNLKDDVHEPTYGWLKKREGDLVLYSDDVESRYFETVEPTGFDDGTVEFSSAGRSRDEYVDEAEQFTAVPRNLDDYDEPEQFTVTPHGITERGMEWTDSIIIPADEIPSKIEQVAATDHVDPSAYETGGLFPETEIEDSGLTLDDHITEVTGIGDSSELIVDLDVETVGEWWDMGAPFFGVAPAWHDSALEDILGAEFVDETDPQDLMRIFTGYTTGVVYDDEGEQLGGLPNAIFGGFPWDQANWAWFYGNMRSPEHRPAEADNPDGTYQFAFATGDDFPRSTLEFDPEEDTLSGLHPASGAATSMRTKGRSVVRYPAEGLEKGAAYPPKETVEFLSVLFGTDYTNPDVASEHVEVVTTSNSKPHASYVVLFHHPETDAHALIEGDNIVMPEDFDLSGDTYDPIQEWAETAATTIEEREEAFRKEMEVPEYIRRTPLEERDLMVDPQEAGPFTMDDRTGPHPDDQHREDQYPDDEEAAIAEDLAQQIEHEQRMKDAEDASVYDPIADMEDENSAQDDGADDDLRVWEVDVPDDVPREVGEFTLDTEYSAPWSLKWYAYSGSEPSEISATHRTESPWHKVRVDENDVGYSVTVSYRKRHGGLKSNPNRVLTGASRDAALAFAEAYMETFGPDDYDDGDLLDSRDTWQAGRQAAERNMGNLEVTGISHLYPTDWTTDETGSPVPPADDIDDQDNADDVDEWAQALETLRAEYGDSYGERVEAVADIRRAAETEPPRSLADEGVTQPIFRYQDVDPADAWNQIQERAGEDDAEQIREVIIEAADEIGTDADDSDDVYDPTDDLEIGDNDAIDTETDTTPGEDRDLLLEVEGIGPKRADALLEAFDDGRSVAQRAASNWGAVADVDGISEDTARELFDRMKEAGVYDNLRDDTTEGVNSTTVNVNGQPSQAILEDPDEDTGQADDVPETDDLSDALVARGINRITANHLKDSYDTIDDVASAVANADDVTDLKGVGDGSAEEVRAAFVDHNAGDVQDDVADDPKIDPTEIDTDCDNTKDDCTDGDRDACKALVEECGFDREEAEELLAEAKRADGELPPKAKRALSTAWTSYKQAIKKGHEAVEAAEKIKDYQGEPKHAERSMAIINGIREAYGQEPIDFDGVPEVPDVDVPEPVSGPVTPETAGVDVEIEADVYDPILEFS
ncbi:helix-hairpin-helix domain-containing protein [Natribaculum luteum]|uniref:Helix-hairpin-helix domain-containing protein n=1 Tax=Natribaculum luteum TaxID=1586232 RepID=A0ABD5NWL4_9EURY|nr:helix-hairpin-helix domain-containing protein [Natribaculum luteum]